MTRWTERTLWVKQGDRIIQAVTSTMSPPELRDVLGCGEVQLEIIPATQMEPCRQCPLLDECMGSVWNDTLRMSGPSNTEGKKRSLTFVHTCVICLEQSFTRLGKGGASVVPNGCPRWGPANGSALPCNGCRNLDRQADEAHPLYKIRTAAASSLMEALLKGGEPRTSALSRTLIPLSPDYEQDEVLLAQSTHILQRIIADIAERFPVLIQVPEEPTHLYLSSLERIYLALLQHPDDPTLVIKQFLLSFSRSRSCQLAALPVADRKMAYRVWEGFVRAIL